MKSSKILHDTIMQVVENQLTAGDPVETRQTLDRLLREGHSDKEAKRLIGCVVAAEIFDVLKNQEMYDHDRFVRALNALPVIPE